LGGFKSHRKQQSTSNDYYTKPTFSNQVKKKQLIRSRDGLPLSKERPPHKFVPANPTDAKETIKNENFILYLADFESKRKKDFDDHLKNKRKMLSGPFKPGYFHDN